MSAPPDPAAEWSDYWRSTAADGCTAALPPATSAAIIQSWRKLLKNLPHGSRVIDIACGRGAVLGLARAAGCTVTGVDLARVDGVDPAISGGIDAAQLPFADASFDVAVSQFGAEYAGLMAAGLEAARVAKTHIWLLLHAAEGPLVSGAAELVTQCGWLGTRFAALVTAASPTMTYTAENLEILRADILIRAETAANTSLLEAAWQALGAQLAAPDPAALAALAEEIAAWAARLRLLTAAAPGASEVAELGRALTARGWRVTIRDEGAPPAGRWLLASR